MLGAKYPVAFREAVLGVVPVFLINPAHQSR